MSISPCRKISAGVENPRPLAERNRSNSDQRKLTERTIIHQPSTNEREMELGDFSFSDVFGKLSSETLNFAPTYCFTPYQHSSNFRENIEPAFSFIFPSPSPKETVKRKELYVPPNREELKDSRIAEPSELERSRDEIVHSKLTDSGCMFATTEDYESAEIEAQVKVQKGAEDLYNDNLKPDDERKVDNPENTEDSTSATPSYSTVSSYSSIDGDSNVSDATTSYSVSSSESDSNSRTFQFTMG
jgi:hypothetical protein